MQSLIEKMVRACSALVVVVPATDDGGNSGRIIAAVGGPAVGDLRRIVNLFGLITTRHRAIWRFLKYRLPSDCVTANREWTEIFYHRHAIWRDLPAEFIRVADSFFATFVSYIPSDFSFEDASLGNLYLSGARLRFGNVNAGVFYLARIWSIPMNHLVMPSCEVGSDGQATLALQLESGEIVIGQNEISHPPEEGSFTVDKTVAALAPLPGKVKRLYCVDADGVEFSPMPSPPLLYHLTKLSRGGPKAANVVVFGRGSFLTSLLPSLLAPEVVALLRVAKVPKVWIVNGTPDRETSYLCEGSAVPLGVAALLALWLRLVKVTTSSASEIVTDVVVPEGGQIAIEAEEMRRTFPKVKVHTVASVAERKEGEGPRYDDTALFARIEQICCEVEGGTEQAQL